MSTHHDGVEISPADLKFRFQLNKQLLANISINNSLDKRVAFKVKTTAPKKYVVRPSSGIVDGKNTVNIQVIMQAQKDYPTDFANCKDKFMVQTTILADHEQIEKDVTFNKESREDLKESRLRVVLEGPAAPPSPVPEANESDEDASRAVDRDVAIATTAAGAAAETTAAAAGGDRLKTAYHDLSIVVKESREDLKESRLRVVLEGPAAPPSPVPEANESDEAVARDVAIPTTAAGAAAETTAAAVGGDRLRTANHDLSVVSKENNSLKTQVEKLIKERDNLRRTLDQVQLQGSTASKAPVNDAVRFRVSIIHIIFVAIIAFLIATSLELELLHGAKLVAAAFAQGCVHELACR
eukprot:CAMPEP_0202919824 /NCGR_PEP_ID=MMETSP1392-20130828/76531_1 /ASSEMBLY_ACC=CAM_ASM_000868 /TAXON_ID=225041 /ORGANISM="Chlamydomonas chlamydogama, Strain SAG 11-48b" /LENGTH=353 /DNA_ID=CAMNT_0049613283 /DNA_START=723 /DNA_END=1786 /DNA_ORIENTATION=+